MSLKERVMEEQRLKACRMEADWLTEGRQENDWTRIMRSVLSLTG